MKYVEDIPANWSDSPVGKKEVQIPKMALLKHQAVIAFEWLVHKTSAKISKPDWEAGSEGLGLDDLVPYISFF